MRPYFDISAWPTRYLITLLAVVCLALVAVAMSACSDIPRMNPQLKRTLDDNQRFGF